MRWLNMSIVIIILAGLCTIAVLTSVESYNKKKNIENESYRQGYIQGSIDAIDNLNKIEKTSSGLTISYKKPCIKGNK